MIHDAATHPLVVTVEDGVRQGGAGMAIADAIAGLDERRNAPPTLVLGVPVAYLAQGKPDAILANLGLDGPGIAASVKKALA
jgi:1-deoxy-D-xylulose-5-phosphate synthase